MEKQNKIFIEGLGWLEVVPDGDDFQLQEGDWEYAEACSLLGEMMGLGPWPDDSVGQAAFKRLFWLRASQESPARFALLVQTVFRIVESFVEEIQQAEGPEAGEEAKIFLACNKGQCHMRVIDDLLEIIGSLWF